MFVLHIEDPARQEIQRAADWYEFRTPGLGSRFTTRVRRVLELIEENPLLYPKIHGSIRRAHLHMFPYSILYDVRSDAIRVIACYHDARDPEPFIDNRM